MALIIALLLAIAYQDFRYRSVSWFLFPAVFVLTAYEGFHQVGIARQLTFFGINMGIIAVQILFLWAYFSLKHRKRTATFDTYIGTGDLLFFVVMASCYSPVNFVLFMLAGLVLTLIISLVTALAVKSWQFTIPLAGAMALVLVATFGGSFFFSHFSRFRDIFITMQLF